MKLVVGYDQALAALCYRRNLRELASHPSMGGTISLAEIDYFAERLAETSVYSRVERLGNPWTNEDERELARLNVREASRAQLQKCEDVANNILILEGLVGRTAVISRTSYEVMKAKEKRLKIVRTLYAKTSRGKFRNSSEAKVLRGMSTHTFDWVRLLSFLPGNDAMQLLASLPSHRIIMS